MKRRYNLTEQPDSFNTWVTKSIKIFAETNYLDKLIEIYPFSWSEAKGIDEDLRRKISLALNREDGQELMKLLLLTDRFPYEEPLWHTLKNAKGAWENNPKQLERIAANLLKMKKQEFFARIDAPPAVHTQLGPKFNNWLAQRYDRVDATTFEASTKGIAVLGGSESIGLSFVKDILRQKLDKRPDLVAKVDTTYILGEAKWVGNSGGNQEKQVNEVLRFCAGSYNNVRRIGIIDGFPWMHETKKGRITGAKEAVMVQETEYPIMSALVLPDYLDYVHQSHTTV
jgi:hypothetical protein